MTHRIDTSGSLTHLVLRSIHIYQLIFSVDKSFFSQNEKVLFEFVLEPPFAHSYLAMHI